MYIWRVIWRGCYKVQLGLFIYSLGLSKIPRLFCQGICSLYGGGSKKIL